MVKSTDGDTILDFRIKTCDGYAARVEFLQETRNKRVQSATAPHKKNVNNLHIELDHPSKTITHVIAKAMHIQIIGTFKPCEDNALRKAKQQGMSKRLLFDQHFRGGGFSLM